MKLLKRNDAVSQVVGYVLSLGVMALVVSVSIVSCNQILNDKTSAAAKIHAQEIANRIADAIVNVKLVKEQYPEANYSTTVDIPVRLLDSLGYYIDVNNERVRVRSRSGTVNVDSTIFNVADHLSMDVTGGIHGDQGDVTVYCNKSNYIYKIDFGNQDSLSRFGYTRVTHESIKDPDDISIWNFPDHKYRTKIEITNPTSLDAGLLNDFQILIQLNDENFNHNLANSDGSDLRFVDYDNKELDYWIERWYPSDTHTSRIWVELEAGVAPKSSQDIKMYYGNPDADPQSDGDETFLFFDNFSKDNVDAAKWDIYENPACGSNNDYEGEVYVEDGKLVITNGSAVESLPAYDIDPDYELGQPVIIETKAKADGLDLYREASMFARCDSDADPPHHNSFVFSSGSLSNNFNLNIINYIDQNPEEPCKPIWNCNNNKNENETNRGWYRLRYTLNDTEDVVTRYYYENYTFDGYGSVQYSECVDGSFGLCTTDVDGTIAYYDWIYVRKFAEETTTDVSDNYDEQFPYSTVLGLTESLCFGWDDVTKLFSKVNSDSGISSVYWDGSASDNSPGFWIQGLVPYKTYSLTITLGDGDESYEIDDIILNVQGSTIYSDIDLNTNSELVTYWVNDVIADASGEIEINFEDSGGNSYYWAIEGLTIEDTKREIYVR